MKYVPGLCGCLSASENVRAGRQCDAAQMVMFTALQSEYLLQSTGLADPTVTANGVVGKTNSCNETVGYLSIETAEKCFNLKHKSVRRRLSCHRDEFLYEVNLRAI